MARLLGEDSVPQEDKLRDGLTIRYYEISKFELRLRWTLSFIFSHSHKITWKRTKELAKEGKLASKCYAGACAHPLWTNVYKLK
mgnify:FL=1